MKFLGGFGIKRGERFVEEEDGRLDGKRPRDADPLALAAALQKIESADAPTASMKQGTAHLCIADPLGRAVGLREGRWANLLASHPPMANRIAALREMAFQAKS